MIQDLIRFLLPREDHFYEFLERQATVAHNGAKALSKFATNGQTAAEAREAVQAFEHDGDKIVHEMEEALAKTFVTPIDREDLQKLSAELDNVIDLTNGAVRACDMLGVLKPNEPMEALIQVIVDCTAKINAAMPLLRKHQYTEIVVIARQVRELEKKGDGIYRDAVSKLFHAEDVDAKVLIREKTVLEDLENAIDQCDAIADTLANLAVKHG
jgi:uncharacterized protein